MTGSQGPPALPGYPPRSAGQVPDPQEELFIRYMGVDRGGERARVHLANLWARKRSRVAPRYTDATASGAYAELGTSPRPRRPVPVGCDEGETALSSAPDERGHHIGHAECQRTRG